MKRICILLIYIAFTFLVVAQSNIRLNNYWGDMHLINPASIYDKYDAEFIIAARKQWLGIQGAPTTFFASGTTYFENFHTQLGLSLTQDKVGYTSISNANLSYGYAIMFQQNWQLHLGIAANFQLLNYDIHSINVFDNTDNNLYQGLQSKNAFNADIGAEVTNEFFRIGVVSQNMLSLFPSTNPIQTNTNYMYARYYQNTNGIMNFGGGVCAIQYADIYQMEFNLTSYFKFKQNNGLTEKPDLFDIGLFYRTKSELGMILGFNLSESLHVSYSYDYHFGSISLGSFGTNEIMITYNLKKKPICHNCWY